MTPQAAYLNKLIHSTIPITKKMGIRVTRFSGDSILFSAPLDKNKNDKGTAFAGSLYSLLVLTGWGFVTLALQDEGLECRVVIHKGEITYHTPVESHEFQALCKKPGPDEWEQFKNNVKNELKGKINLTIEIADDKETQVTFKALYYAFVNKGPSS